MLKLFAPGNIPAFHYGKWEEQRGRGKSIFASAAKTKVSILVKHLETSVVDQGCQQRESFAADASLSSPYHLVPYM